MNVSVSPLNGHISFSMSFVTENITVSHSKAGSVKEDTDSPEWRQRATVADISPLTISPLPLSPPLLLLYFATLPVNLMLLVNLSVLKVLNLCCGFQRMYALVP